MCLYSSFGKQIFSLTLFFLLSPITKANSYLPVTAWRQAPVAWQTLPPLPAPDGLRPCCAFGYNLKAKLFFIPVPFYKIYNVVDAEHIGQHRYNNRPFNSIINLLGLGAENNGLVYSQNGGFIDIAHVRDSADNTLYLFSQIYAHLSQHWQLDREPELATRRIVLMPFTQTLTAQQRYTVSAWLAARIAFQLAAWHEIAQWYGYESVPGFPEGVSAFSPEDLYSNLLGVQLATQIILQGDAQNLTNYQQQMDRLLPLALQQLASGPFKETEEHFNAIDGLWWDSHQRLPEKFLLLKRNYDTDSDRLPTIIPNVMTDHIQRLALPAEYRWHTIEQGQEQLHILHYDQIAQLQLWPTKQMAQLPMPTAAQYYTVKDFYALAEYAAKQDEITLRQLEQNS